MEQSPISYLFEQKKKIYSETPEEIKESKNSGRTFLEWLKDQRYSESTIKVYKCRLGDFLKNYDVNEEGILAYIRKKKYSTQPIHFIKLYLEWSGKEELIKTIPKKRGTADYTKKRDKGVQYLTMSQIKRLIQFSKNIGKSDIALAIEFLYMYGLRISEMASLDKTSFNFETNEMVVIGKRNKIRYIPLYKQHVPVIKLILERLNVDDKLFSFNKRQSKNLSMVRYYQRHLKEIGRGCLPNVRSVHPHMLRHSTGTLMRQDGADLVEIQELLGHSDISTTRIYVDMVDRNKLKNRINKIGGVLNATS